jgi:hypothetical protein
LAYTAAMRRLAVLLALPVLGVACGGSGDELFSPTPTRSCLTEHGAAIGGKLDFVASTATGGAFRARLGTNRVTVVFGETEDDAKQIELAYHRTAAPNVGVSDILGREGNVVLLWKEHPADDDLRTVAECLK